MRKRLHFNAHNVIEGSTTSTVCRFKTENTETHRLNWHCFQYNGKWIRCWKGFLIKFILLLFNYCIVNCSHSLYYVALCTKSNSRLSFVWLNDKLIRFNLHLNVYVCVLNREFKFDKLYLILMVTVLFHRTIYISTLCIVYVMWIDDDMNGMWYNLTCSTSTHSFSSWKTKRLHGWF